MFASQNHIVTSFNCITWKVTKTGNLRASKANFNWKLSVCRLKNNLQVFCHLPLGDLWADGFILPPPPPPQKVAVFELQGLCLCLDTPSPAQTVH